MVVIPKGLYRVSTLFSQLLFRFRLEVCRNDIYREPFKSFHYINVTLQSSRSYLAATILSFPSLTNSLRRLDCLVRFASTSLMLSSTAVSMS